MGNSKESNRKREGTFPICGKEHWLLFSMLFYSAHSSSNGRSGCSERWEGCKCLRPANDLQLPLRSGNRYLVATGLLHPFFCILCFFLKKKVPEVSLSLYNGMQKARFAGIFVFTHWSLLQSTVCLLLFSVCCVSGLLNMSLWWPPSISERPVKHGLLDFALASKGPLFTLIIPPLYGWKVKGCCYSYSSQAASLWLL